MSRIRLIPILLGAGVALLVIAMAQLAPQRITEAQAARGERDGVDGGAASQEVRCEWTYIDEVSFPNIGEDGAIELDRTWMTMSEGGWRLVAVTQKNHYIFERCRPGLISRAAPAEVGESHTDCPSICGRFQRLFRSDQARADAGAHCTRWCGKDTAYKLCAQRAQDQAAAEGCLRL